MNVQTHIFERVSIERRKNVVNVEVFYNPHVSSDLNVNFMQIANADSLFIQKFRKARLQIVAKH